MCGVLRLSTEPVSVRGAGRLMQQTVEIILERRGPCFLMRFIWPAVPGAASADRNRSCLVSDRHSVAGT